MKKSILLVLLALNALMQAAGGTMMLSAPAKMAREVFHVASSAGVEQLMGVIGAAVIGFCLLTLWALASILRGQPSGYELALALGASLIVISVGMYATGSCSSGELDLAKGLAITLAAWLARAELKVRDRAGRAPVPTSLHQRAS